jgi:hypothetical protein
MTSIFTDPQLGSARKRNPKNTKILDVFFIFNCKLPYSMPHLLSSIDYSDRELGLETAPQRKWRRLESGEHVGQETGASCPWPNQYPG